MNNFCERRHCAVVGVLVTSSSSALPSLQHPSPLPALRHLPFPHPFFPADQLGMALLWRSRNEAADPRRLTWVVPSPRGHSLTSAAAQDHDGHAAVELFCRQERVEKNVQSQQTQQRKGRLSGAARAGAPTGETREVKPGQNRP